VRNIEAQYGKTFHPVLDPAVALVEFGLPANLLPVSSNDANIAKN